MEDLPLPPINRRIKEVRSVLGLSQVKFSLLTALSKSYIAGIETGRIPVNERLVKLVCSCFNVNEVWLRDSEGEMFLEPMTEDSRFVNLVSTVKALPSKYQEFVYKMLDMLVKLKEP